MLGLSDPALGPGRPEAPPLEGNFPFEFRWLFLHSCIVNCGCSSAFLRTWGNTCKMGTLTGPSSEHGFEGEVSVPAAASEEALRPSTSIRG